MTIWTRPTVEATTATDFPTDRPTDESSTR